MDLEAVIEQVWGLTWSLESTKSGDTLGGRNPASLEMHLEGVIEEVGRCTWRP